MKDRYNSYDKFTLIQYHNGIEQFNYDIVVDWAMELLDKGNESENVLILASFSKPVDSYEIKPYLSSVLREFQIEDKTGDEAVLALIKFHLNEIVNNIAIKENLYAIYDIFLEKDYLNEDKYGLMPFYLLYHGWEGLLSIGINCYFEGADLDNIRDVLRQQAEIWLEKNSKN